MVFVKSLLVGLLAAALGVLLGAIMLLLIYRPFGNRALDIGPFLKNPLYWFIVALLFVSGFYWQLRKTT